MISDYIISATYIEAIMYYYRIDLL